MLSGREERFRAVQRPNPILLFALSAFGHGQGAPAIDARVLAHSESGTSASPGYALVAFRGPQTASDLAWLDELTGPVQRSDGTPLARAYFADDVFAVWVADEETARALRRSPRVARLERFGPQRKFDALELARSGRAEGALWDFDLLPGQAPECVAAELEARGAHALELVTYRGRGPYYLAFWIVAASADSIPRLAEVEGVRWIRPRQDSPGEGWSELDGHAVAELAAGARSGQLDGRWAARGDAYGEFAVFLDLLAFDAPELAVRLEWDTASAFAALGEPVKNARMAEDEGTRQARRVGEPATSSALREALALAVPARASDDEYLSYDVRRAQGFAAASDPTRTLEFFCFDASLPLEVALAWTDEPGASGPGPQRRNDLDLVVQAPDGTVYAGRSFLASGESAPSGERDALGTHERVRVAAPAVGTWKVAVEPVRGPFSVRQGYALVVRGSVLAQSTRQGLAVPATAVLRPNAGLLTTRGNLSTVDLARLRASDEDRLVVRDRDQLTLSFEPLLPAGASVSAIRVLVEHQEEPRVLAGDVQWKLGQGLLTSPTIVSTFSAPLRLGADALDLWTPTSLVGDANALKLVVQNNSRDDGALLDEVRVEVDYLVPDAPPHITSIPRTSTVLGQAYLYDADGRAEATGTAPLTWSLVSAPAGCAIGATTGQVTWTPSATGSFTVTLRATNAFGFENQSFTVSVSNQAPLPASLFPANAAAIVYCPSERLAFGSAASEQRLNVFLPPGTPPASGWPVVLNNRAGGGLSSLPLARLDNTGATAPLHAFVARGIAVVDFGVTAIGGGLGLFYPPGHRSLRYESFRPADDNPEKEAEWAIQWLKTQTVFRLDPARVCLRGS